MEVRVRKSTSSQGMVKPMSWSNPNSSSARLRRPWNSGRPKNEMGTMYRARFWPTYTAKCPFGTSNGSPSSPYPFFLPKLEHLLTIKIGSCGVWEVGDRPRVIGLCVSEKGQRGVQAHLCVDPLIDSLGPS
ncbi:transducin family protein / WD-40 repeat family protein [Striga asiatica]|uniref:Transducin family protein / WD-40 repeat family protein n=1 Tax=Striga asiatica TaxID=4170 RepID=A0A5A7PTN6_STRAF|nr:transducin family protein / WD-40 repeat family protein [Striga asiatica]